MISYRYLQDGLIFGLEEDAKFGNTGPQDLLVLRDIIL